MSNNIKVLLVGCGYMGIEYSKVLKALGINVVAIGNSAEGVAKYHEATGINAIPGGIESVIESIEEIPTFAIVATPVGTLMKTTILLLEKGVKRILVEKPAGTNYDDIKLISDKANEKGAEVFVAYNRRFYSAVEKALRIIEDDGGVTSFFFEFTEWSNSIRKLIKPDGEKDIWLLANSTHVIDLAFFLGGMPAQMSSFVAGKLDWHSNGAIYSGAGKTSNDVLFSYHANWNAPGRWGVEVLTHRHRLYFRPMEKLAIQEIDSVEVKFVEIDDELDREFKPGLYKQVVAFMDESNRDKRLLDIREHLIMMKLYEKIAGITN